MALAGDWHGNEWWALLALKHLRSLGITDVFHLGDFGIWPGRGGARYIRDVQKFLAQADMRIFVTPGNHEDYAQIAELPVIDAGHRFGPMPWLTDNIAILPRGHRFTVDGWSVVSLGGAPSVDRHLRTEGRSWWPEEMVSEADVAAVAAGGPADIMLAHDCPNDPYLTRQVSAIVADPHGISHQAQAYAAVGRERVHRAFEAVQPRVFAHGHYHVKEAREIYVSGWDHRTLMVSCADDGSPGNVAMLHLPDRETGNMPRLEWIEVPRPGSVIPRG